jgi:uncharacterized membrane protein YuzA (DUF378 family)
MKDIINNSIDWVSIKLNAVCLLGLFNGDLISFALTVLATLTTIAYNVLKIKKELKSKK